MTSRQPATGYAWTSDVAGQAARIERQMAQVIQAIKDFRGRAGLDHLTAEVGFGTRPAVIVIDLANFWTQPRYPAYCAQSDRVIANVGPLLDAARAAGVAVIFTTMAYQVTDGPVSDAAIMARKFHAPDGATDAGSDGSAIDVRLCRAPGDHVITKITSSAFEHTHLATMLHNAGVDTVILAGVVTSGCVRATAADAFANGFRTIVVEDCVDDVMPGATQWTLYDITTKIGDVCGSAEVVEYFRRLPATAGKDPRG